MTNKTQPLSPARAGVGSAVVFDSGTGKTQVLAHSAVVSSPIGGSTWNADGTASVSWVPRGPAVLNADGATSVSFASSTKPSVWNADGVTTAAFAGYSITPIGTLNADGVTSVSFTSQAVLYNPCAWNADGSTDVRFIAPPSVWNANGQANVSFGGGASTAPFHADGNGYAQFGGRQLWLMTLHADGVANAAWTGIAAGNGIWNANGHASVEFDTASLAKWNADGTSSVAWSGNAIANAALEADGSSWVSFSAETPGPFYFAWINYSEVWGPQHLRIDEVVFSFNLVHEEGQCATLELVVKNPFSGFLAFGRRQWCFFSLSSGPLFKGRLVSIPSDMIGETVTYHFTAMPLDMLDQQRALADSMMVLPYWDPVWITEAQRLDPQSVLEGYSRHWCVDRVTLQVTTSDLVVGEDGVATFSEDDAFYDSVKPTIDKAPLLSVYVNATVNWIQYAVGTIDLGTKNWTAWTAGGIIGSWPKANVGLGAGWTVKHASALDPAGDVKSAELQYKITSKGQSDFDHPFTIIYDNFGIGHAKENFIHRFGDLVSFNWSSTTPYLTAKRVGYVSSSGDLVPLGTENGLQSLSPPGAVFVSSKEEHITVGDEALGVAPGGSASESGTTVYNWNLFSKLVISYEAKRQRTENVRFMLTAHMQPIFSDPAEQGASGLAANFAQNSEYMEINGSVGLEGPYGNFRGLFQPEANYLQYDIFIIQSGADTFAFQVIRDHQALPFFDQETAAQNFIPNAYYDEGNIVYDGLNYFQIMYPGNYPSLPSTTGGINPTTSQIFDPFYQMLAVVPTDNPHSGPRLYTPVPQFRGNWEAGGEVLVSGDMVIAPDGTWYRVAIGHKTATSFYRFAVDSTGRLLYELMLNPPPIGDVSRGSYFPTSRGNLSLQNLIHRARAKIIARARALQIDFECRYELVMNNVSLRKNVELFDRRLPGGSALGKVISYGIKGDGQSGALLGSVKIASIAGYGVSVQVVGGTPTYVTADYVGNDYQYYDNVLVAVGTNDISYSPPSDVGATVDDGLRFPLGPEVVKETIQTFGAIAGV